jgi:pyruvate dehydrogenase E2 component (dihydrolipoamide acetyltransferase)
MPIDFKLPNLGENIESGDIVSVLVHEGDQIEANQPVVEVETGKATVELPCPHAGKVVKLYVKAGQSVPVGGLLLSIEASSAPAGAPAAKPAPTGKAADKPAASEKPAPAKSGPAKPAAAASKAAAPKAPAPSAAGKPTSAPTPAPALTAVAPAPESAPVSPASAATNGGAARRAASTAELPAVTAPAGPATRRLARELGVDLARVTGTGPGGRITEDDVKKAVRQSAAAHVAAPRKVTVPNAAPSQDAWGPIQLQPLSKIRKTIAVNMARSSATIPHVTNFDDADITELERIRKGGMADYVGTELKLTMMAFVMKAVAQALQLHPVINATLDFEAEQVIYKDYVNLGVAVDTERGLVVPVMREVDRMTIPQIAQGLTEIAAKARGNQFGLDDMRGGTFTISNLGAIGGTYSTPIINHPEVAVLLLGRSRKLPHVTDDDQIKVRLMMPLSLSYDHRLVDGAAAARFLNEVKNYLQVPGRLLLAT